MTANLRPMNLGEILDRTFQIYRARFWAFVGLAALPALCMLAVHLGDMLWLHARTLIHPYRQPEVALWGFIVWLGFYHIAAFLGFLAMPALVKQASGVILREPTSARSSLQFVKERWRRFLWLSILKLAAVLMVSELLATAIFLVGAWIIDRTGGFNGDGAQALALLMILLAAAFCIPLYLWLGACFSLSVPAAALENRHAVAAMRRSWRLSKGSRWRIQLVWLLMAGFGWVLMFGLQWSVRIVVLAIHHGLYFAPTGQRIYVASIYGLYAAIGAFIGSLMPIAVTLFYYDQRIRHEGYDIERMMEAAGMNATTAGKAPALTPAAPEGVQA